MSDAASAVKSLSQNLLDTQLKQDLTYLTKHMKVCNEYKTVDAVLKDSKGEIIFEKKDVLAPQTWSQLSINIAAEKYFVKTGPHAESSITAMCRRISYAIGNSAIDNQYIDKDSVQAFVSVLEKLLENQYFCFNSPVWFNVGIYEKPRISACFILGIEDNMESILETGAIEGRIYKLGSGSGINYSPLRGKGEALSKGGHSSGVMSFVKSHDAIAGAIKSGGTTRRAAKMVILNVDHPDVEEFVDSKTEEEKKAQALIAAGYDSDFRSETGAYSTVAFQNANHSVRVSDNFMEGLKHNSEWDLVGKNKEIVKTIKSKELFRKISEAAWRSGDPGLQFDTTINKWNTLSADGRINGSNPCSEYMSLDNTSCNLASINLMKFYIDGGAGVGQHHFNWDLFEVVSRFVTLCLDILVSDASYPTDTISKNVLNYRQIGLGYANLGSFLMATGHAYDSEDGRCIATRITSLMTAAAYKESSIIASKLGSFPAYNKNKIAVQEVMNRHLDAVTDDNNLQDFDLSYWTDVNDSIFTNGLRNSYVTNIAPTGTIGLVMGCDTTGIEPELSLVKYKKMVGGGVEKIVNGTVTLALQNLGYNEANINEVLDFIKENGSVKGCRVLTPAHEKLFATSFDPKGNHIAWKGHIDMMAAVQPYLSGSISKTVNMPTESTVEDVELAYIYAWETGLKCIAIYRDGCKDSQPLTTSKETPIEAKIDTLERKRLPDERPSITHKFDIAGHEGYFTVGLYENGQPGEVFVTISKEGTFVSGLLDAWATMLSIALQYGAPLSLLVDKIKGHTYEPQGYTNNPNIRIAKSITDYIARYLEQRFCGVATDAIDIKASDVVPSPSAKKDISWGDPCSKCGGHTYQAGTCKICSDCGTTTGCS